VTVADPRAAVASVGFWYHVLEPAPGVVTPGWFDLRPIVERLPWPDVRGKRCLDVGTYDGFLAFELERRGAAEVVATDLDSHKDWDWPPRIAGRVPSALVDVTGPAQGEGFAVAKELLGSRVERDVTSVYDLDPTGLGEFDVVVCGSLLLHLRDPLRALERIRSVCRGHLLSSEQIDLALTVRHPRRPTLTVDGVSDLFQWTVPNAAGHVRMIEASGFDVVRRSRPYSVRFGPSHPSRGHTPRAIATAAARRAITGAAGVPHHAVLARR
jgi:tRNA (mo5U34)-methyltransferase